MGADQAALQLRTHLRRDVLGRERAEAGGDPVVRLDVVSQTFDDLAAAPNLLQCGSRDLDARVAPGNGHNVVEGQRANADMDGADMDGAGSDGADMDGAGSDGADRNGAGI